MSWDQYQDYFLLDETRRGALREDLKGRRHEIEMGTKLTEGEDQWVEALREALSEILRVGSKLEWGRPPGTEIEANEARC